MSDNSLRLSPGFGTSVGYVSAYDPRFGSTNALDRSVSFYTALDVARLRPENYSNGSASVTTNGITNVQLDLIASSEFATPQEAAINAIKVINPTSIAENIEYTGKIRLNPITGMYYADPPILGSDTKAALNFDKESDQSTVGDYHTHGNYFGYDKHGNPIIGNQYYDTLSGTDSEDFSRVDRMGAHALAAYLGKPDYLLWLGTPSGAVKQYSTLTGASMTLKPGNQN